MREIHKLQLKCCTSCFENVFDLHKCLNFYAKIVFTPSTTTEHIMKLSILKWNFYKLIYIIINLLWIN